MKIKMKDMQALGDVLSLELERSKMALDALRDLADERRDDQDLELLWLMFRGFYELANLKTRAAANAIERDLGRIELELDGDGRIVAAALEEKARLVRAAG